MGYPKVRSQVIHGYEQIHVSPQVRVEWISWIMRIGGNDESGSLSKTRLFGVSSLIALIIAVPALLVTFLMYYYVKADLLITVSLGLLTLFIGMGVGYRVAKKFVTSD